MTYFFPGDFFKNGTFHKKQVGAMAPCLPLQLTAIGGAQLGSDSKFGPTALLLDGAGDYLTVEENGGGAPITIRNTIIAESTIEFFAKTTSDANGSFFGHGNGSPNWTPSTSGNLIICYQTAGGLVVQLNSPTGAVTLSATVSFIGTWNHVAIVLGSSRTSLYVNSVRVATITASTLPVYLATTGAEVFHIGELASLGFGYDLDGSIDEFRVSNVKRYDEYLTTLTVPTSAFTTDANTILLSHFDDVPGSTDLIDDKCEVV